MWYANEKKKVRKSTNDAIAYLKQKSTKDHDLKEKELDLRKTELQSLLQIDKLKLQNNNNHDESFYESNAGTGAATEFTSNAYDTVATRKQNLNAFN